MLLPSIFDKRGDNYVPRPDEPSPFGPDTQTLVDNPWVNWKRSLKGFDERAEGSPTLLREALKERLERERFTDAEAFEFDTPDLLTTDGRHLSLAWVMYYKARTGFNWERVHRFGLEKMKKETRLSDDIFNGNEQLRTQWMSGLKDDAGLRMRLTDSFTTRTIANPDVDSEFNVVIPVKQIDDGKGGTKRIPWGDPVITDKDGTYLVTLEIKSGDWNGEPRIDCTLHSITGASVLCKDDIEKFMPTVVRIIVRALVCQFDDTPQPQPRNDKDKLVTAIHKSEVQPKAEFTLGVFPPLVKEVLGSHFCDLTMEKTEVDKRLKVLERGAMGARRELIDKHYLVSQLIGYGLTFRVQNGRVEFRVYKRNKKNANPALGEKQLTSVFSLCDGGHAEAIPDFQDYLAFSDDGQPLFNTSIMDLAATVDYSYRREAQQEVSYYKGDEDITDQVVQSAIPVGFVKDSSDDPGFVGNRHFGIVYLSETPAFATFEMNEPNNDAVAWIDHETLVELVFARAYVKGQQTLTFPVGDIICDAGVTVRDRLVLDKPEFTEFLEWDFEPWSQYIIHNLHNLVERILKRETGVRV